MSIINKFNEFGGFVNENSDPMENDNIKQIVNMISEVLPEKFSDHIGTKFNFQYLQHIWDGKSGEAKGTETGNRMLELVSIKPEFSTGGIVFVLTLKDEEGNALEMDLTSEMYTSSYDDMNDIDIETVDTKKLIIGNYTDRTYGDKNHRSNVNFLLADSDDTTKMLDDIKSFFDTLIGSMTEIFMKNK